MWSALSAVPVLVGTREAIVYQCVASHCWVSIGSGGDAPRVTPVRSVAVAWPDPSLFSFKLSGCLQPVTPAKTENCQRHAEHFSVGR